MSIDLNPLATSVYKHNYPDTVCLNKNILSLTPEMIDGKNINSIIVNVCDHTNTMQELLDNKQ